MNAEFERLLTNMVRIGRVVQVDAENALAVLEIGAITTDWLPWIASRAGATRTWSAPTVDEQRLLFSPGGDMGQGVIGPAIYQEKFPAPADSKDQERIVFPDGSTVEYDSSTGTLTITVAAAGNVVINCKHATVNAGEDVTVKTKTATVQASSTIELDAPLVHCTQAMTVDGLLTYKGGLSGSGGKGASLSGSLTLNGDLASTGAMTNNGKNVGSGLRVSGVRSGSDTSGTPV